MTEVLTVPYEATLPSFGSPAARKHVRPRDFVLQGNNGAWVTIPDDEYELDKKYGIVRQRSEDAAGNEVDWEAYTSYRWSGTIVISGSRATITNEALTFADADYADIEAGPDDQIQDSLDSVEDDDNSSDESQSDNYVPGVSGYFIDRVTGDAEFNNIIARGTIYADAGEIGGWQILAARLKSVNGDIVLNSNIPKITLSADADSVTYGSGAGVFIGLDDGAYKMRIGDPAGQYLAWDGADLWDTGHKIGGTVGGKINGWKIRAGYIESKNDNIRLDANNQYIAIGAPVPSGYLTGIGYWVGDDGGMYKFHLGDPSGAYIAWNGSKLIKKGAKHKGTSELGDSDDGENDNDLLVVYGHVQSNNWVSGATGSGWRIGYGGNATFRNVTVRGELHASVFVKNMIEAKAGTLIVAKSAGKLEEDMAVPGSGTWNMYIKDPPDTGWLFDDNDICQIKETQGSISTTWFTVTRVSQSGGKQRYTCTWQSGTRPLTYEKGNVVVDFGASGQGWLEMSADGTGAPYYSVRTHAGAPWTTVTERGRFGNMNGAFGVASNYYGFGAGDYSAGNYLKYDTNGGFVLKAGGGHVKADAIGISLQVGGTYDARAALQFVDSGGVLVGHMSGWTNAGGHTIWLQTNIANALPSELDLHGIANSNQNAIVQIAAGSYLSGPQVKIKMWHKDATSQDFIDYYAPSGHNFTYGNVGIGTPSQTTPDAKLKIVMSTYATYFGYGANQDVYIRPGTASGVVIMDVGKIGVGTASPEEILEIESSIPGLRISSLYPMESTSNTVLSQIIFGTHYDVRNQARIYMWGDFATTGYDSDLRFAVGPAWNKPTQPVDKMVIKYSGNVGIGTVNPGYLLDVNGTIHYTTLTASSDRRFKKNLQPIQNALKLLESLTAYRFEWNERINKVRNGYKLHEPTFGLVAQEVEQVLPELVSTWKLDDGIPDARAISYERMVPLLIAAVNELRAMVEKRGNAKGEVL